MKLLEDIVLDLLIHHLNDNKSKIILDHSTYIQKKDIVISSKTNMEYYTLKEVAV